MKFILKFIKYGFYTLIALIMLGVLTVVIGHKFIYPIESSATPTLPDIQEDGFCLGVGCSEQAKTAEDFIPVFARQIKVYNRIAPDLWPENKVVNLSALVQSIEHNKSWLISPEGEFRTVTKKQVKELAPMRSRYNIGFNYFKNDTISGVYLALSEEALKNYLEFERYQYLGTYDLFIIFSHEMFHYLEQGDDWKSPDEILNRSRGDRYDDVEARVQRALLFNQILSAASTLNVDERDSLILNVLSTYNKYKTNFETDYKNALYFDRIEGTAHYYELMTCLYSGYPDQIHSAGALDSALTVVARHTNPFGSVGLVKSSYTIGGWTGVLLDRISKNKNDWKRRIVEEPNLTPLDILAEAYAGRDLPKPQVISESFRDEVIQNIELEKNNKVAPGIFRFLYQLFF